MKLYGIFDVVGNRVINYFSANSDIIAVRMMSTSDEKTINRYRGFNLVCLSDLDDSGVPTNAYNVTICRMCDCEVKLNELLEKEGL